MTILFLVYTIKVARKTSINLLTTSAILFWSLDQLEPATSKL